MRYLLLIHVDESRLSKLSPEEDARMMAECAAFTDKLQGVGAYVGGHRLKPTTAATTIRVQDGAVLATDGPFAETKEQLGGFYMIDVKDRSEAVTWAARAPHARYASIEVRPVWQQGDESTR